MKKIFTLIAVAALAISAQAQGTFSVQNGDAGVPAGTSVTSVDNITFTWGVAGGNNFKGGNKKSEVLKDVLGSTAYCEGNDENGKIDSGTVYFFEPAKAGKLTVGTVINAGKAFYVQEVSGPTDVSFTATQTDGTPVTLSSDGKLADKLTGGLITFSVTAGKKYAVWVSGSKLGFYGFKYEVSGTDNITTVKAADDANAPAYNLAGQKVTEGYKGVVIQNGQKRLQK